ncbi:hypothetical protein MTO96_030358 [Rhipicephalus appendiculatus]
MRQHPKDRTTKVNSFTRRHCVELDTCWAVPVAAACITFLSCILSSSYGYLYVLFMEELHVDREEAAWPQTALVISGGCVGLLVSIMQKKFSTCHITLVGGFITSAGVLASSFAPNIAWLSATFGVIQGFFRDSRGSYDNLYIMLAGLNLGVAVLLVVLVFQAARRRRRSLPKNVSPGITQEESNSL